MEDAGETRALGQISVYLSAEQLAAVRVQAERRETSVASVIRLYVREGLIRDGLLEQAS